MNNVTNENFRGAMARESTMDPPINAIHNHIIDCCYIRLARSAAAISVSTFGSMHAPLSDAIFVRDIKSISLVIRSGSPGSPVRSSGVGGGEGGGGCCGVSSGGGGSMAVVWRRRCGGVVAG